MLRTNLLQNYVPRMDIAEFTHGRGGEASAAIAKRVQLSRQRAHARSSHLNAQIESPLQDDACQLDVASMKLLTRAATELHLSPRGVTRTLRVARTIADLACCEQIGRAHLAEALAMRARVN